MAKRIGYGTQFSGKKLHTLYNQRGEWRSLCQGDTGGGKPDTFARPSREEHCANCRRAEEAIASTLNDPIDEP